MFKRLRARSSVSQSLGTHELELAKHFRILRTLGQGGYSTVYKVERLSDGQRYALKVSDVDRLSPQSACDVVREIGLLASLDHPHLVQYHESFVDQSKLCIITEYLSGGDLATLLQRRRDACQRLPEPQVWSAFLQITLAVQALHRAHILHRDIKPQNVLLTSQGALKLGDLGIARILDKVFTRASSGTPHYMPPEFWRRQPCSYSADIWALGCLLHELCSLKPCFLRARQADMEAELLRGELPPIPSRYSQDLQAVVLALLHPDAATRPTADEVLAMPEVGRHVHLVPAALRRAASGSSARSSSEALPSLLFPSVLPALLAPLSVPSRLADWETLNDIMPPPRYASGGDTVTAALRRRRASASAGDLLALEKRAGGGGGGGGGGAASHAPGTQALSSEPGSPRLALEASFSAPWSAGPEPQGWAATALAAAQLRAARNRLMVTRRSVDAAPSASRGAAPEAEAGVGRARALTAGENRPDLLGGGPFAAAAQASLAEPAFLLPPGVKAQPLQPGLVVAAGAPAATLAALGRGSGAGEGAGGSSPATAASDASGATPSPPRSSFGHRTSGSMPAAAGNVADGSMLYGPDSRNSSLAPASASGCPPPLFIDAVLAAIEARASGGALAQMESAAARADGAVPPTPAPSGADAASLCGSASGLPRLDSAASDEAGRKTKGFWRRLSHTKLARLEQAQ